MRAGWLLVAVLSMAAASPPAGWHADLRVVARFSPAVGTQPEAAQAPAPSPPAPAPAAPAQTPAEGAQVVLSAARVALGGDGKLAGIRTFEARGRTRQVRGNNLVPIEFEIWCELPDKYVRRDEIPAQESGPTTNGFMGDALIQWPPPATPAAGRSPGPPAKPAPGGAAAPAPPVAASSVAPPSAPSSAPAAKPPATPPDPGAARVASAKQDFVRLTLGMFAASFPTYPMTFSLAGQAEAPQGTADIVDAKGAGTFALRLFVSHETHLPIMVTWTTPATAVVIIAEGEPQPENVAPGTIVVKAPPLPAGSAPKEEREQYAALIQDLRKRTLAGAKPVEHRIYYADYRDIGNGIRFPFRLRRATAGQTLEETNFDGFTTNVRIDPRRFSPAK